MSTARPLDRYPLIRARRVERAREALSKVYSNDMKFEPLERRRAVDITVNNCQLTQTGLNYTGYGAAVRAHFPGSKLVTLSFPTRGSGSLVIGGTERVLNRQHGLVMPADASFAASLNADFEHVVFRLDPKVLESKLEAILGTAVDAPLQFDPLLDFSGTCAHLLRDHFFFLVDMVGTSPVPIPKLLQAEFEQTLMVMFLYATRHRYSRLLDDDVAQVAPAEVRRAEEYIEANGCRPITLEDIAAVTGVSALSLYRSFKSYRGYSPMQFAERVRRRK